MSLSKFFHTSEYIDKSAEYDFHKGRECFGTAALDYLNDHQDYYKIIENNLKYFELPSDTASVENVVKHIGYHYHEKFLSFNKEPEFYRDLFEDVRKPDDILSELKNHQDDFEPTLVLGSHFGAMPFLVGALNYYNMDISAVVKFPSQEFKELQENKIKKVRRALNCGRLKFIEPNAELMTKVSRAVKNGKTLYTVFDEHTSTSIKVDFLGKMLMGGAGVNNIIDMVGKENIHVYYSVMIREGDRYRLDINKVDAKKSDYIQNIFYDYEKYISQNYEQWFFLQEVHENIPGHHI